jgi:5-oxoprolinase (ATP-hydrolysing) subunit A
MRPLLNIDAGEHDDEPEALYALADALNVACGGHAGDAHSMQRVLRACVRHGTRAGAHPSYPDRAHFGRRTMEIAEAELALSIEAQCGALLQAAREVGASIVHLKLHGALYHDANRSASLARVCLERALRVLGPVAIVGPASGAWRTEANARGLSYLVEGFADRGVRDDGMLIPRDQPGALITEPGACAARARALAEMGIDTLCVHGDTQNALAIAKAVADTLRTLKG